MCYYLREYFSLHPLSSPTHGLFRPSEKRECLKMLPGTAGGARQCRNAMLNAKMATSVQKMMDGNEPSGEKRMDHSWRRCTDRLWPDRLLLRLSHPPAMGLPQ